MTVRIDPSLIHWQQWCISHGNRGWKCNTYSHTLAYPVCREWIWTHLTMKVEARVENEVGEPSIFIGIAWHWRWYVSPHVMHDKAFPFSLSSHIAQRIKYELETLLGGQIRISFSTFRWFSGPCVMPQQNVYLLRCNWHEWQNCTFCKRVSSHEYAWYY